MTRIDRSAGAEYRVLVIDGRWDGLPVAVENLIAGRLVQAGLRVDIDAISDPTVALRVLDEHPEALDGYAAVLAILPRRTGWRGGSKRLTRVVERVSRRVPTLLIDHPYDDGMGVPPSGTEWLGPPVDTLLLPAGIDPAGAARKIARALHVVLDELELRRPVAPIMVVVPPSAAAALVRDDIGVVVVNRLDWITRVARDTFGLAFASVNLLQLGSVTTIASSGPLSADHPAHDSLTAIALRTTGVTVMPDTWLDRDACSRTPTQGPHAVRFYASWPIRSDPGQLIGTLCVWDLAPHAAEEFDFDALRDLALLTEGELIVARTTPARSAPVAQ